MNSRVGEREAMDHELQTIRSEGADSTQYMEGHAVTPFQAADQRSRLVAAIARRYSIENWVRLFPTPHFGC